MTATWPVTALLLATLAAGAVAGFHHLGRSRKRGVVWAHLLLALAALAAVAAIVGSSETGLASWPVALVALAASLGWGASRVWRRGAAGAGQAMLIGHVFAGVAGFFVFLAWAADR